MLAPRASRSGHAIGVSKLENDYESRRKSDHNMCRTGSVHTPTMSEYLPITADEIVAQSVAAAEAGAAIIHLHARDPKDGRPSQDEALYMRFFRVSSRRRTRS